MNHKNAAVLWTGGKDSALAFYEAQEADYNVTHLVTFTPKNPRFLAHPLELMKQQVECIGLPHLQIEIDEPIRQGYEKAISNLKKQYGIETLITGDIDLVDGHPNWIRECSKPSGMRVYMPLWNRDRNELIDRLLSLEFDVIFSCVKEPWFESGWAGKSLNKTSWKQLQTKNRETGLDICGENGEFHTMVLSAPYFKKNISITCSSHVQRENMMFVKVESKVI